MVKSYAGSWEKIGTVDNIGEAGEPKKIALTKALRENQVVVFELRKGAKVYTTVWAYSDTLMELTVVTAKPTTTNNACKFAVPLGSSSALTGKTGDILGIWHQADNKTLWAHLATATASLNIDVYVVSNI